MASDTIYPERSGIEPGRSQFDSRGRQHQSVNSSGVVKSLLKTNNGRGGRPGWTIFSDTYASAKIRVRRRNISFHCLCGLYIIHTKLTFEENIKDCKKVSQKVCSGKSFIFNENLTKKSYRQFIYNFSFLLLSNGLDVS